MTGNHFSCNLTVRSQTLLREMLINTEMFSPPGLSFSGTGWAQLREQGRTVRHSTLRISLVVDRTSSQGLLLWVGSHPAPFISLEVVRTRAVVCEYDPGEGEVSRMVLPLTSGGSPQLEIEVRWSEREVRLTVDSDTTARPLHKPLPSAPLYIGGRPGGEKQLVGCVQSCRLNDKVLSLKKDLELVNVDGGNPTCRSTTPPAVSTPGPPTGVTNKNLPRVCFEGSVWVRYRDELLYLKMILARSPDSLGQMLNFLQHGCQKPEEKKRLDGTFWAEIVGTKSVV